MCGRVIYLLYSAYISWVEVFTNSCFEGDRCVPHARDSAGAQILRDSAGAQILAEFIL